MLKEKLQKSFDHIHKESEIYKAWEKDIIATAQTSANGKSFTIILPPPNITGFLHIGHAFTSTIQDILLRFKRQQGFKTLGQPGVDHAGIATQIVVDRQLTAQGISRLEIGREAFIQEIWKWKEQSGCQIIHQLQRLGMSVDWNRLRFTMDEKSSKAVLKAFVTLYNDGLIYRAKKLINWDPTLKTAVSDLEVTNKDTKGNLWYIRYKAVDSDQFLTVATTRPETLFGDTAVAVHPDDERYQSWIGKQVYVPLIQRKIPVVADMHSDPSKGTGVVKITPAHDFNDFEVGKRHNLPILNIMDDEAHLNDQVPHEFQGLSCEKARSLVLQALEDQNLLEQTESITHSVPYNERSGAVIEPRITNQWFLDAEKLAIPAIQAVEKGEIQFIPDQWKSTYFEWMRNIQPWCISRQIWWGHQIPVWYAPDGEIFCAENEQDAYSQAEQYFTKLGRKTPQLTRDSDVLDTWFSSALWPFSTQGWPEDLSNLDHYPTDVLVTAFDIIFFWVARMIMFSQYFMRDIPFRNIYLHPLVRDEKGQKMSKSKGNVIDPLILMDEYGTDALRFTLAGLAIPGRDIKISQSLVENSRNFITKIWNAAHFLEINHCEWMKDFSPHSSSLHPLNAWIVYQLETFKLKCQNDFENYRFDFITQNIQKFLKDTFCDIYIECLKPLLSNHTNEAEIEQTRQTAAWVFMEFLNVAHPIIPFITEYLWLNFTQSSEMLITRSWSINTVANTPVISLTNTFIETMQEIRSLRGLMNIQPAEKLKLIVQSNDHNDFILQNQYWLRSLGRLEDIIIADDLSNTPGFHFILKEYEFNLTYPSGINRDDIKIILQKKKANLESDLEKLSKKLQNIAYKEAKPDQWNADNMLFSQKSTELAKIRDMEQQLSA